MKRYLSLLIFLFSLSASAQGSQYEQMKNVLDEHSLPLVNMIVDISKVNRNTFTAGEIEIADYQRRTDPEALEVKYHCKYRIRGGYTTTKNKKSYAVKLFDEHGEDLNAEIFGIKEENSWILNSMSIDRTRMRDRVCFDVWNEMSRTPYDTKYDNRNGSEGEFVEVFINGDYHGLYCMTDKIDRKLLGLKKAKVSDDGQVTIRGLLYKGLDWKTGWDLRGYNNVATNKKTWNAWELQYPEDYPSIDTWRPLMDLIDFCSDATPEDVFIQEYQNYFYIDNLADFVVFTMALFVRDLPYHNTYLSVVDINEGHRYLVTPWDMDTSLGGNYDGAYYETLAYFDKYDEIAPFNRLSVQNIDGFNDLQASKWREYHETLFSCESIAQRLDHYAEQFTASGAWERERTKWNNNPVPLKESVFEELEYVKDWYAKNYENLCTQYGTNAIDSIDMDSKHSQRTSIYTIDGRRVNENILQRGIYIINGKKTVVK